MDAKIQLLSMSYDEVEALVTSLGEGRFRAKQLFEWVTRGAAFEEMTNLSKALRERLAEKCVVNPVSIRESVTSRLDGTEKYLYELTDGNLIEGVRMRYHYGDTLCVSTQVGCRMGCAFCASTLDGCVRSLTAGKFWGRSSRSTAASGRRAAFTT